MLLCFPYTTRESFCINTMQTFSCFHNVMASLWSFACDKPSRHHPLLPYLPSPLPPPPSLHLLSIQRSINPLVWNEVDLFMLTGALIMGHWLINFKLSFLVSVLPFQLCKENSTFHINLLLLRILSHFSSSHERLRRKKRSRFEWYGKIWMRLALTCSAPIRKKIHF